MDQAGVCFVCGCTENDPCPLPVMNPGTGNPCVIACSWANEERTLCTNPECLEAAFACPMCGISVERHTPFMEAGCQIRAIRIIATQAPQSTIC